MPLVETPVKRKKFFQLAGEHLSDTLEEDVQLVGFAEEGHLVALAVVSGSPGVGVSAGEQDGEGGPTMSRRYQNLSGSPLARWS